MARRYLFLFTAIMLLIPVAAVTMQEDEPAGPVLDITGVNATDLPVALVSANVFGQFGQSVDGLTAADFTLSGDLAEIASIVDVQNVTDDDLPIAVVLVIDTSTSMEGVPLAEAKAAAAVFVESIGDNDSIAILQFDSSVRVVQDYTSDKDVLLSAIDGLVSSGQTALYDAGFVGVETAANAPYPRRVVVMLSDGAEYGGIAETGQVAQRSEANAEDALAQAEIDGVPVYTIGLGFNTDRRYLETLANGTNALNFNAPTPEELTAIYGNIAALLRTQYIITLDADLPLDGTEYAFGLQATTPEGATNVDESVLRAPIPVPIVSAPDLPDAPISEITDVTFGVAADDEIERFDFTSTPDLGQPVLGDDGVTFTVDPRTLSPGPVTVDLTVTDIDGDAGSVSATFDIASLPSEFTVTGIEPGQVFESIFVPEDTIPIAVDVTYSQTDVESVTYSINGAEVASQTEAPFGLDVPVLSTFSGMSGDQTLDVTVTTTSGEMTTVSVPFTITIVPSPTPTLTPTPTFTPSPTVDFNATSTADAEAALIVQATADAEGTAVAQSTIDAQSTLDSEATANAVLTADAEATGRAQATVNAQATVDAEAAEQATADAIMTADAQATMDAQADEQATADAIMTADAQATVDAEADEQATADAIMTADAQATMDAEADEQATTDAIMTADAQATFEADENAQATANVMMTANAQATFDTEATFDAEANAQATADAIMTADAQATLDAEADEQATADAILTADAESTTVALANVQQEQATADAEATANAMMTADAQATLDAEEEADAQATLDAEATANAQDTADADATDDANATLTAEFAANEQATADAQATQDALATLDAEVTEDPTEVPPTLTATPAPSATPVGDLVEIETGDDDDDSTDLTPLLLIGGGLLLFILLLLFFLNRRRQAE